MSGQPIADAFGVKLATTVFGFAGAIISLAFIRDLSRTQAAISVVVGLVTSIALTPVIAGWIGLNHPGIENGVAFLLGLCAMSVLPVLRNSLPNQLRKKLSSMLGIQDDQS